ncbi:transposase [Vagococcus elongatus]|uniref:Transposase n=1 Tax=Vagococcus elongatus TaxID=180344 RepID=A0A430B4H8_9ENTE|nr:hypothetical protein CBF29_01920 [Vagococcus elongatus]
MRVPRTLDGKFTSDLFERYQHSKQAMVLEIIEMVISSISMRKVTEASEIIIDCQTVSKFLE